MESTSGERAAMTIRQTNPFFAFNSKKIQVIQRWKTNPFPQPLEVAFSGTL